MPCRRSKIARFFLSQLVQILLKAVFPPLRRRAFHLPWNSTASSSLATGGSFLRSHTSLGQTPRAGVVILVFLGCLSQLFQFEAHSCASLCGILSRATISPEVAGSAWTYVTFWN